MNQADKIPVFLVLLSYFLLLSIVSSSEVGRSIFQLYFLRFPIPVHKQGNLVHHHHQNIVLSSSFFLVIVLLKLFGLFCIAVHFRVSFVQFQSYSNHNPRSQILKFLFFL